MYSYSLYNINISIYYKIVLELDYNLSFAIFTTYKPSIIAISDSKPSSTVNAEYLFYIECIV